MATSKPQHSANGVEVNYSMTVQGLDLPANRRVALRRYRSLSSMANGNGITACRTGCLAIFITSWLLTSVQNR